MSASKRKLSESLDEDLLCYVCKKVFKEPIVLECGDSFCKSCIDKVWNNGKPPCCPKCNKEFPSKYTVNSIPCSMVQKSSRSEPTEKAGKSYQEQGCQCPLGSHCCLDHKEALTFFCQEDESLICFTCVGSSKHRGHSFLPPQEAADTFQNILKTAASDRRSEMKLLEECQRRQEKKLSGIQNEAQILEQHITSEFAKLCQFLQDKEQQLKQQLKEEKEGILGKIEENLRKIEEMKEEVQKKIYGIQSKLEQKDSLHFLTGMKIIKKRAMEEHKFNEREGNEDDSLSLGEYKGPLQYTAWKEMLSHVNPGLSHLTLDQKKAHPHLILTDSLTSVMYGGVKLQLSDNPERYDSRLCVLGSQGFTSGRHYWEVKVWNKTDWDVGVTNDSSRKKGKVDVNPEHGYWIVVLRSGNEYRAQDLTPKDLMVTVQPKKVGVYLDYEGGQVSFYNADNMSHLYTFTDTFTETLYPFFSPCCNVGDKNKEPLKVFHMKL